MLRLVLWDIDNTLIDNAGVSEEIYSGAFLKLTGRTPGQPARTEGKTDPHIMADLLARNGEPEMPWPRVQAALEASGQEHASALSRRGRVLPGVLDVLIALGQLPGVVQTIVTGNIQANAAVKLGSLGLLDYVDLSIGGFGSDDANRPQLVAIAVQRSTTKYGSNGGEVPAVVVIGDTPRDIDAGRRNGARVLAVASGVHDVSSLQQEGADHVLVDLTDLDAVLAFVRRGLGFDVGTV